MIVADASAFVALLIDKPPGIRSLLVGRFYQPTESLHAPHLVSLEVMQTLRRHVFDGSLLESEALAALGRFREIPITRYPHEQFIERIWQLRNNVTAYDAAYVALSEALDAPLVTTDRRLGNASGHHAQIEVF